MRRRERAGGLRADLPQRLEADFGRRHDDRAASALRRSSMTANTVPSVLPMS